LAVESDELVVFPTGTLELTSPDRIQRQANIIFICRNQNGDHSQEHRVVAEGNCDSLEPWHAYPSTTTA
jgi:hypothetical protein